MAMLSGKKIKEKVDNGDIKVDPFDSDNIGPNSLDLRIGNELRYYVDDYGVPLDIAYSEELERANNIINPASECPMGCRENLINDLSERGAILDMKSSNNTLSVDISDDGYVLMPGRGYLASTIECVGTDKYVPKLEGRSSIGRLFVSVHHTAGFGDVGFEGKWTLEVTVIHPITVYPDTRVCQVSFENVEGDAELYSDRDGSKYNGQSRPTESRSHFDFK